MNTIMDKTEELFWAAATCFRLTANIAVSDYYEFRLYVSKHAVIRMRRGYGGGTRPIQ